MQKTVALPIVFFAVCLGLFLVLFYPFQAITFIWNNLTIDLRIISYPIAFTGLYISLGWFAYTLIGQLPFGGNNYTKFNPHGPTVTVLVAARNEESVIQNIIADLKAQTYPFWNAVIVAHNCQDQTYTKAKAEADERVNVLRFDEGYGKPIALNYAVKHATGECIAVFDADTRIKPDFLEKIMPYLKEYDAVQSRIDTSNRHKLLPAIIDLEWVCYTDLSENFGMKTGIFGLLGGTGQIVKREALEKCSFWNEKALVEDYDLSLAMLKKGYRIAFANNVAIYDEKPIEIKMLLRQRARWLRGNFQVLKNQSKGLWRSPQLYHLCVANIGIFIVYYGLVLNLLHLSTGVWYNTFYFEFWWILWVAQVVILWIRATIIRRLKGFLLFPLFYLFSFHWILAFPYMFKIKTWKQSKTTHYGQTSV